MLPSSSTCSPPGLSQTNPIQGETIEERLERLLDDADESELDEND